MSTLRIHIKVDQTDDQRRYAPQMFDLSVRVYDEHGRLVGSTTRATPMLPGDEARYSVVLPDSEIRGDPR